MTDEQITPEFEELRYTPAVESLYLVAVWTATALAYSACVSAAYFFSKDQPQATEIAEFILGISWLAAGLIFVPAYLTLRTRAVLLIRLYPDRVGIDRYGKIFEVPFVEVRRVTFSNLPGIGAWFILHLKSGNRARFSAGVLGSQRVLESLRRANPDACDELQLQAFQLKARVLSNSWRRLQSAIDAWPWLLTKYLWFPIFAGVLLPDLILLLRGNQILSYFYHDALHFLVVPILIALVLAGIVGLILHWLCELLLRLRDHYTEASSANTAAIQRAALLASELFYYLLTFALYTFIFFRTH